jgi:hypothetical protein
VAPLVTRGAAATTGNVYEPYLDLTPHLDVLNERLLQGFTFAESVYMSLKVLSWMTTVVGDPLYRPFAGTQGGAWRTEPDAAAEPWIALQKELRKASRSGLTQTVERVRILQGLADKKDALKLIDRTLQRTQPADRAKLLNDIRNEIAPPPPPPTPVGSPKKP